MKRSEMIKQIQDGRTLWDVIIIGGGASGLGVAVDAAKRGYKTLLLEMSDFSKGTSSRSTKLVHGGVRYLQQGNVSLVLEALRERGLMIQNAPHLCRNQSFVVPNYDWWEGPFYGIGLKVYDVLAGKLGLGPSKNLSVDRTLELIPTLETEGLKGGVIYYDGQFDDSRFSVNLAQTSAEHGGVLINYMKVNGLIKNNDMVEGVKAQDTLSGEEYEILGRVVVNATGVFSDDVLQMDDPDAEPIIAPSQGVHLVIDGKFLSGETAVMVPHTADGRVLFAVPWHGKVVLGTTDTPVDDTTLEPRAKEDEIEFILSHAAQYLTGNPTRDDVRSVFAGLRPLVKPSGESKKTKAISRDHTIIVAPSGLVTVAGGKWTTYRKMAEDVVDQAALVAGLNVVECETEELRIHGWKKNMDRTDPLHLYGSDKIAIDAMIKERPELGEKLHERLPYLKAEVVWAAREEMAMTIEDVLARRTRSILLDAEASRDMAPETARLMAEEMGKDDAWAKDQVATYNDLVDGYVLSAS